jgi:hypothetical protein
MAKYVTLEKAIRDLVVEQPFTRIQGMLTWLQKTNLTKEMEEAAMRCDVSYPWTGDHGLLAAVDGEETYLARTEEEYIEIVKPTPQHPNIQDGTAA